eukprot:gene8146-9677_t
MSAPSPGSFGRVVLSCDKCQWVGAGIQLSSKRIVGPAAQGQQTPSGPGSPNISTRRRCLSIHAATTAMMLRRLWLQAATAMMLRRLWLQAAIAMMLLWLCLQAAHRYDAAMIAAHRYDAAMIVATGAPDMMLRRLWLQAATAVMLL